MITEEFGQLYFKKAKEKDIDLLFGWINDPEVRAQSFSQELITYNDHVKWFSAKLADIHCYLYILYDGSTALGMIRFDRHGDEYIVNYLVDRVQRGKGIGTFIISSGIEQFKKDSGFKGYIKALVKSTNIASRKVFKRFNGFEEEDTQNKNLFCFKMLIK